jgi:hypothetical protein
MTRRSYIVGAVLLLSLGASIYFLPSIAFVVARTGIARLADPDSTLGVRIEFSKEWFPIAENGSTVGKILIPTSSVPTVIYYKNDWFDPWGSKQVAVSRLPSSANSKSQESVETTLYPWGRVKEGPSRSSGTSIYLVEKLDLAIATGDPSSLNEIVRIDRLR